LANSGSRVTNYARIFTHKASFTNGKKIAVAADALMDLASVINFSSRF